MSTSTTTESSTFTIEQTQEITETATNNDSGANFRESQPIQPTKPEDAGEAGENKPDSTETGEAADTSGRFGIAGKPSTKISFRISANLSLLFKPYAGLSKKNEFCIKPGGVNGAIKPFTSSSGRKQFKKVGIRISYSIKQLLSVRDKLEFKTLPSEIEQIPGVFEEGLGDFETLTNQTITLSSTVTEKISPSKLRKPTDATSNVSTVTTTVTTTEVTSTYGNTQRYDGNDDDASFRNKKTVTPSKISKSKLKKRENKPTADTTEDVVSSVDAIKEKIDKSEVVKPSVSVIDKQQTQSISASTESTVSAPGAPSKPSKPLSSFKSKGAWGRGRKQLDPMARLTAAIRMRLNKITLDNFSTLSEQLIQIFEGEISSTEQLEKLVTLIFEKTVQEHVYGPLYAKLCVALSSKNKSFDQLVMGINGKMETKQVDFKTVLVKVCQKEFHKGKGVAIFTDDMDATDRENETIKQKKIFLGRMKFIGHLYLKELIPSKIMTVCLKHLVGQTKPSDDDIEGACTLLQTVGPTLDEDQSVNKGELSKYYQKLKSIERNSRKYPVRIRMLIQNLVDLRKNSWKGLESAKVEGPRALKDRNKSSIVSEPNVDTIFDPYDDTLPFDFDALMRGAGVNSNDATEIMSAVVPVSGHVVGQSQQKFRSNNRYSSGAMMANSTSPAMMRNVPVSKEQPKKPTPRTMRKKGRSSGGRRRQLLETAEEEEMVIPQETVYEEEKEAAISSAASAGSVEIGQRKSRLSISGQRPCEVGKSVDEEVLDELTGDYLYVRNNVNEDKFLQTLLTYELSNRSQFILKFIQKAIDGGKGERLAMMIPKLLNQYILTSQELDNGFIEFFKGYTFEDNPQLALGTAQLLAPLIVDNELNFSDVMEWILLDTRQNQPQDDMLKFYDGDGVRNYPKKAKDSKITIVMQLIGELLKELKEACFEDSQYVKKLLTKYNFKIDEYLNQNDIGNKDEIQTEWIKTYGLSFAF